MKKFFLLFAFCALFLIASCGGSSSNDKKQGELYGGCFSDQTCNEGLICDTDNDICIKDPASAEPTNAEPADTEPADTEPTDTEPTDPEPTDVEPTDTEPSDTEPTDTAPARGKGELYGECRANKTCNQGLVCDIENNICIKDYETDDSGDSQPDDDDSTFKDHCTEYDENMYYDAESNGCTCKENYTYDDDTEKCVGRKQTVDCEIPENAHYNSATEIEQTWSGSEWLPSEVGTYNLEASETECRFLCDENYNWNGSECVANLCASDPCLSVSYSNGKCYTDGENYICGCKENYGWNGTSCSSDVHVGTCSGLIENAEWNSTPIISQTWSGSVWTPSTIASYNTTASTTQCRYKCKANYQWNSSTSTCVAKTKTANCVGKPDNAVWNTASSITQTWDGSTMTWTPSTTGTYNTTADSSECRFTCDTNFQWNSSKSKCVGKTQSIHCSGNPVNSYWSNSSMTQTWNGTEWIPSSRATLSPEGTSCINACCFRCRDGYTFDGQDCNKECALGETAQIYSDTCQTPKNIANICTGQTKCYNYGSSPITCPSSGQNFYGQDPQYSCESKKLYTSTSDYFIDDGNTVLAWQKTLSTSTYTQEEAANYCKNLVIADYHWRLPTRQELLTIVDNGKYNPAINTAAFPDTPSTDFWTSDNYDSSNGWAVNFKYGITKYVSKTTSNRVRCVHGAKRKEYDTSTNNGTVSSNVTYFPTNQITKLEWLKLNSTTAQTWQNALAACQNYSGYRLPNKNELASISIDERYRNNSSYNYKYQNAPNGYWWSSTGVYDDYSYNVWCLNSSTGAITTCSKSNTYGVLCVK